MPTDESIELLARRFEDCTLPAAEWNHAAHLTVALWYVRRLGRDGALERIRAGLRRYVVAIGGNPAAYHETITRAWIDVIARFAASDEARALPLAEQAERLIARCGDKEHLLAYYTRERLLSPEARAGWVEPDRAPIEPGPA